MDVNDINVMEKILSLAETGNFDRAVSVSEELENKDIAPIDIFKFLSLFVQNSNSAAHFWRDYIAKNVGSNSLVLYSTITDSNSFDFSDFAKVFKRVGSGGQLRIGQFVELVTRDTETCMIQTDVLSIEHLTIHIILDFPSNVNENFYISLLGDDCSESFRFSNFYISCCEDGFTINKDLRTPRLISFSTDQNFICIYIDGILVRKKYLDKKGIFNQIVFKLIGSPGADLGGIIKGVEIWSTEKTFNGFIKSQEDFFYLQLNDSLLNNDISKVHNLISSIDGLSLEMYAPAICKQLTEELNKKGYRDWIFEKILNSLPSSYSQAWEYDNNDKIPKPLLMIENLGVEFYRFPNKRFSVNSILNRGIEKFDVLENINFKLYPGDIMGIIGANGAGKSTLLKTIAGLVPIKKGRVLLNGWHLLVSPGLGVRNELTGRENIYLAGSFMGLSRKEIDKLFDEIVDFSELEGSIDKPYKFYSDGMKSRLIFSMSTSVAPEILMLDELLSAGDIKFQKKAATRMDELIEKAKVVVVVTHSVPFVASKCNKALLISKGKEIAYGDPQLVISYYLNELHMLPDECIDDNPNNISMTQHLYQQGALATSTGGK